jgi:hypothetical protein
MGCVSVPSLPYYELTPDVARLEIHTPTGGSPKRPLTHAGEPPLCAPRPGGGHLHTRQQGSGAHRKMAQLCG